MKMMKVQLALVLAVVHIVFAEDCVSRDYGYGSIVCVCNAEHCDTLQPIKKVKSPNYVKYTTNKDGLRLKKETGKFEASKDGAENLISIETESFQEILGFGGAFSDATGINIKALSENLQEKILRAYFGEEGIEYTIGRVPIGGTDFSTRPYSYCDTENNTADNELKNFSLASEDKDYKISLIQKAHNLTNAELKLFASAWIAPGWMKTNPDFTAKDSFLKAEMYQVWADYFVKFLDAYKEENITFWGITTGNEPLTAFLSKPVPSVAWYPNQMRKWIKENLGPTIRSSQHSDIKILAVDDNIVVLPWVLDLLFTDEEVKNYIDGVALHWYEDFLLGPDNVAAIHKKYPDKFILYTEACNGYIAQRVVLGSWDGAEHYAYNIIRNLNNFAVGWTDWNMALDMEGGPTFINNFVDSPIIVNADGKEFLKQPSYYALGHFSKFIPKGSVRLSLTADQKNVYVTAFKRTDGGTVVIILNTNAHLVISTIRDVAGDINLRLTAKSITSIVYWND